MFRLYETNDAPEKQLRPQEPLSLALSLSTDPARKEGAPRKVRSQMHRYARRRPPAGSRLSVPLAQRRSETHHVPGRRGRLSRGALQGKTQPRRRETRGDTSEVQEDVGRLREKIVLQSGTADLGRDFFHMVGHAEMGVFRAEDA